MARLLRETLQASEDFLVLVELPPAVPGRPDPARRLLADWVAGADRWMPSGFRLAAVTCPQNPGGRPCLDPVDRWFSLQRAGLLDQIDFVLHVTCKDHNGDALTSALMGAVERGTCTLLALTGDVPLEGKGVFEWDSLVLLQQVARINRRQILQARSSWDAVPQLTAGAAVSPFKYSAASLRQQYIKMDKKIRAGAAFLVTQVGWDWRRSQDLFEVLTQWGHATPVFGNVFLLHGRGPVLERMHAGGLPGCYVSDRLYETVKSESFAASVTRAAQQVAMYRDLGARGVDLGGVEDVATLQQILQQAAAIGADWVRYRDNLHFPPPRCGDGVTPPPRPTWRDRGFARLHAGLMDPNRPGFHRLRRGLRALGADRPEGWVARGLGALEHGVKGGWFHCQHCGDCFLPENAGICSLGDCVKGLPNVPCGDATVDGRCGNDPKRPCCGELIYRAAGVHPDGEARLRQTINPTRRARLAGQPSILNYLFGKDHAMTQALISIGEAIHASIPKTAPIMREIAERDDLPEDHGPVRTIRALIEDQVAEGAHYIAVNVDALGENAPQRAVEQMRRYVRWVRRWGQGVPVCIDSSDDDVLLAGLEQWYADGQDVAPALINSIKVHNADRVMPWRRRFAFAFVGLLMPDEAASTGGGVDERLAMATTLFTLATERHGFVPGEIFFDATVFPLAIDLPMTPGTPGYTYTTFETMRRIRADRRFEGVHLSLGISNCCRDLPGRKVGICRAYVAEAMKAGLDAGIVNVTHHYGQREPDPELVALVAAFAEMDGAPEKTERAVALMGRFCQSCRGA